MAREASNPGAEGTNALFVLDLIRTNEFQVWFLVIHVTQEHT